LPGGSFSRGYRAVEWIPVACGRFDAAMSSDPRSPEGESVTAREMSGTAAMGLEVLGRPAS
jgi:hypothetical protein